MFDMKTEKYQLAVLLCFILTIIGIVVYNVCTYGVSSI